MQRLKLSSVRMLGIDAGSTYKSIKKLLLEYDLHSRVVALGSDGASVMAGKDNGVAAKLRGDIPYLLALR